MSKENEAKGTTVLNNALVWFGAGVSIAEILTGTSFAPLGVGKAAAAILLGHLIGGLMMFFVGMIGAVERKSAMESTKRDFGAYGGRFFALLNVIQLVGWTGIMIYDGAVSAETIYPFGVAVWAIIIGAFILIWVLLGLKHLEKINIVAMAALFILTLMLCKLIFFSGHDLSAPEGEAMSFGAAVELAVAMPLSWLPVISDYTREAEKPVKATAVSVVVYCLVSIFMYIIGMGAVLYTGETNIGLIMSKSGLGLAAILIVIFSTVTTTFLDANSAGVSFTSVLSRVGEKKGAVIATIIGTAAAAIFNMDNITNFLYFIGSVFAPMAAVQIANFFFFRKKEMGKADHIADMAVWLLGFIVYRLLMKTDLPVGNTLPTMLITLFICCIVHKGMALKKE